MGVPGYFRPYGRDRGTVAHVVGTATAAMLAVTGVNDAYRIVGFSLYINRSTTGIVDIDLIETGSGAVIAQARGLQLTGTSGVTAFFPFPGFIIPNNEGVSMQAASNAATGNSIAMVWYYIDQIT